MVAFWGPRGRVYLAVLTLALAGALYAEFSTVSSRGTHIVQRSSAKDGGGDTRQLQMQGEPQVHLLHAGEQQGGSAAAAAGGRGGDGSGGGAVLPRPRGGVRFAEVHPDLGASPNVEQLAPTVWGHMEKKGHLAWEHWSTKRSEPRFDHFLSWRLNRTLNGAGDLTRDSYTCKGADHPTYPFPGCHVFINHNYKYIYIRSPKAASTSIVDELGECNNVRTRGYNASTCMGMHGTWEHFYKDPKNITDFWHDYFVFGFVRNPWKRAYSLFKYMQSDGCMSGDSMKEERCLIDWGEFCTDPWGSTDRVSDMGCLQRTKSYMYFHMMDQHHCMVTDKGEWAVDYIGRVEQANDDWAEVVKEINKRRDPAFPELEFHELVPKNVRTGNVSSPYTGQYAHCLDSVSSWYACDADKFGYLKGGGAAAAAAPSNRRMLAR